MSEIEPVPTAERITPEILAAEEGIVRWTLGEFGYQDLVGSVVTITIGDKPYNVIAEQFLTLYPEGSVHRKSTRLQLRGFKETPKDDLDYAGDRAAIATRMSFFFGAPKPKRS